MTNIITDAGFRLLREQYDFYLKTERPRVVKEVANAADCAKGEGEKRLLEIDAILRHLGNRLKALKVAPQPPADPTTVSIGCWVTCEDQDEKDYCCQLVGPDEIFVFEDRISIDSPLGKAMLGRMVDDKILVRGITGDQIVVIVAIGATKDSV